MRIFAKFRSCYRGVASYNVVVNSPNGSDSFRVEHYYWTAEQYRQDYDPRIWNYTPEEYERARVARAGGHFLFLGDPAPADVVQACREAR